MYEPTSRKVSGTSTYLRAAGLEASRLNILLSFVFLYANDVFGFNCY